MAKDFCPEGMVGHKLGELKLSSGRKKGKMISFKANFGKFDPKGSLKDLEKLED